MELRKGTIEDLKKALEIVNKKYDNNIQFNRLDPKRFTLKCISSKGKGHSIGYPNRDYKTGKIIKKGRNLISCCWHVHGDFFDALFSVNPNCIVISRGNKITKDYGNWEDFNVGSMAYPQYASEKCECE